MGTLAHELRKVATQAKRSARDGAKSTTIATGLDDVLPAPLKGRCRVVAISRGTLTLSAIDAPTRFTLDRWLRTIGGPLVKERFVAVKKIVLLRHS